ncbi:MAG: S41 family peptidase, partial [Pseudomonadota bacterium]
VQLATFDAVWDQVRTQYFDYARIEEDWLAAREELRPQAAGTSAQELRSLLNGMLERVGESHFLVLPSTELSADDVRSASAAAEEADATPDNSNDDSGADAEEPGLRATGVSVRLVEDALLVSQVGEANEGRIQPGWELTAIGEAQLDEPLASVLETPEPDARKRAALYLEFSVNSLIGYPAEPDDLSLTFEDAGGNSKTVSIDTSPEPVDVFQLGNLPDMAFEHETSIVETAGGCIGQLSFTAWVPQLMDEFLASRDALFACQGLVIDLRGNPGGVITTMMPLSSHLFSEITLLGQLKREDGRIDFRAFPRVVDDAGNRITPYSGPVAILVDSLTASTSEMFTAGMQALGRARVFGTTSSGMALPAQMLPLPNGDRMMYAFADYIDGKGRRIEGIGVIPDEATPLSRDILLAGEDPTLQAAVSWLQASADAGP